MASQHLAASGVHPEVYVFGRNEIPSGRQDHMLVGGMVRLFHGHPLLRTLLPSAGSVSFGWIQLRMGETLEVRAEQRSVLLVGCDGAAQLSPIDRAIGRDDLVALPAGQLCRISGVGPDGFHALAIVLGEAQGVLASPPASDQLTLDGLLAHNLRRLEQVAQGRFFTMLRDGTLDSRDKRRAYLDGVQVFSDMFQTMIFSRQASCRDDLYAPVFLQHLRAELGHNELLAQRSDKQVSKDAVLAATASWFAYQMHVLDNVEKAAVIHLVLETSGQHFHALARDRFADESNRAYYEVHADNDDEHAKMGIRLLDGHHPSVYRRLHQIVDEAWDMFEAMVNRIVDSVVRA